MRKRPPGKRVSEIHQERRDLILGMWASGASMNDIMDAVGGCSTEWIRSVVTRARTRGDERAVVRNPKLLGKAKTPNTKRWEPRPDPLPPGYSRPPADYSNLSFTGLLMGDPPRGRSALDQKRGISQ